MHFKEGLLSEAGVQHHRPGSHVPLGTERAARMPSSDQRIRAASDLMKAKRGRRELLETLLREHSATSTSMSTSITCDLRDIYDYSYPYVYVKYVVLRRFGLRRRHGDGYESCGRFAPHNFQALCPILGHHTGFLVQQRWSEESALRSTSSTSSMSL